MPKKTTPAKKPTVVKKPTVAYVASTAPVASQTRFVGVALGLMIGVAFTGYILKSAPPVAYAATAPVAIDYDKITAAVKAAFPTAPVAVAAPVAAPVVHKAKAKVRHTAPAMARVIYIRHCTCTF